MANELDIGVRFGAEGIPQVTKSITDLTNQLKRFQAGLNTTTGVDSIARLNKAIETTKERIKSLQQFTGAAGAGIAGGIVKGSNQAAQSLTNLSRVAQDAPFGFIGIQNNLNPLLESFARLKQETGSSSGAFKALASSLAGPAGVGLALGVVTGLITVAVQKYGSLGNALSALLGDYSSLAKANDELAKSFAESTGQAAGESAVINSLVSIGRNEALSKEARLEAINKLNDEYDEFLPKLTLENINTQAITNSVNKLNEALLRQAKIKGLTDLISKEYGKLADVISSAAQESLGFFDNLEAIAKGFGPVNQFSKQFELGLRDQAKEVDNTKLRIKLFEQTLNDLLTTEAIEGTLFTETQKKGVDALKARLAELERIKKVTKDITTLTNIELQIFDVKTKITLRDAVKNGLSKEEVNAALIGLQQELQSAFDREVLAFEAIPKVKVTDVKLAALPEPIESLVSKATGLDKDIKIDIRELKIKLLGIKAVEAEEALKVFVTQLQTGIENSLKNAIGDSANVFGELLGGLFSGEGVGQSLAKAAQGMLNIIGSVLQDVGKQIIAASSLVVLLKKALASLFANPFLGIAVGAGLIALGGLLKNIKFDIPKFAGGVNNFAGGLALVGERGPELVNLPKGSDVIPNHMLGGNSQPIILQPSLKVQGKEIFIMLQQVSGSNGRTGGPTL